MMTPEKKAKLLKLYKKVGGNADNFSINEIKKEVAKINHSTVEKNTHNDQELKVIQRKIDLATKVYESKFVNFRSEWDKTISDVNYNIKRVDGGVASKALDIINNKNRRFFTNGFQIANVYPNINFIADPVNTGITLTSRDNPATKCTEIFVGTNLVVPNVRWSKETPVGAVDGVNTTYTISRTPLTNSFDLVINGQIYTEGVDYTLSGTTITMITVLPLEAASLPFIAKYMY